MRFALAVLLLTAAAAAQFIDGPTPQTQTASLIEPVRPVFSVIAPREERPKVVNREFIAHSIIAGALMAADFESALYQQHHHSNLRESDPIFGAHPSHLRMYATALPLEAANAFLAYQLKKHGHTKLWRVPFFVAEAMHASGIASNFSPRPGGSFVLF